MMTFEQHVKTPVTETSVARLKLAVRGAVQGVGFRPFVYRLANDLGLPGWVNNSSQGVLIEVEGPPAELERFLLRLETDKPPRSFIQNCEASWLDAVGYDGFEIRESASSGDKTALVLPDIATCPDCLREILDPANRRYRYPFTNCTNCGPRFSIIEALPYDRCDTSMKSFRMCPACQAEYDDPTDRRFHTQPNACPACGPQLVCWCSCRREEAGNITTRESPPRHLGGYDALLATTAAVREGQIVAVKGIGGFHLLVNACNESAVRRLRERKRREEKPFALMFPSLESVKEVCEVSPLEERLLKSPEAPIVLLRRLSTINSQLSSLLAPGNPNLGVMLPSNPLHHLLMAELELPVVATSGNMSDEPICTDEYEAFDRLSDIAAVFLVNNRPIVRHVDDSIVRVMLDREMVLRRARGYAPLPFHLPLAADVGRLKSIKGIQSEPPHVGCCETVMAVGAHLKNSVALAVGDQVFLSQHIGDLETEQANSAFRRVVVDLARFYDVQPDIIVADLHPDYRSTQYAEELSRRGPAECSDEGALRRTATVPPGKMLSKSTSHRSPNIFRVQHHLAHALSCIAENEVDLPALGVAWDGTGYGTDGTIWGGELFRVREEGVERVAHLRPFPLPGGDAAVKEPRRAALGLLYDLSLRADKSLSYLGQRFAGVFSDAELAVVERMLSRGVNAPLCSSVGRLFDALASLIGLRHVAAFEGQAAMELEFALEGISTDESYSLSLVAGQPALLLDWSPMIEALLSDIARGVAVGKMSAKFHNALAEAIVLMAREFGELRVALSGGCFQNRYLTERTVTRLREEGFQPYWHQRVPPNDGGIALGQVVAARREFASRSADGCDGGRRIPSNISATAEPAAHCGRSDGHSRAPFKSGDAEPVSRITHHASR